MSYPVEYKYDKNHIWTQLRRDGTVRVGITLQRVRILAGMDLKGDIVNVLLPSAGQQLAQGQSSGTIEGSDAMGEISAPIAGTVTESNGSLRGSPRTVRDDPHGEGRLYTIKPTNAGDLSALMDVDAYEAYVG